jgi:hypothetical protein
LFLRHSKLVFLVEICKFELVVISGCGGGGRERKNFMMAAAFQTLPPRFFVAKGALPGYPLSSVSVGHRASVRAQCVIVVSEKCLKFLILFMLSVS